MKPEIIIFTNGRPTTLPAIEYGAWMGASMQTSVRLIGVDEDPSPSQIDEDTHPLEAVFEQAVEIFTKAGTEYHLEIEQGHAEEVIPRRANVKDALVVVGPLGRPPLRRFLSGRSFHTIMEHVAAPIVYVPQVKLPPKKLLVCLGGLGYELTAEMLAMKVAGMTHAEVVLLTVVPPVDLDYPEAREMRENWQHLEQTDTLAGRSLRRGLELARDAGLQVSVKVRNGNVIEEIMAEVTEGNYDLLCMGSPYSSNALRQLYTPNVTAEIAEHDRVPILTARFARPG